METDHVSNFDNVKSPWLLNDGKSCLSKIKIRIGRIKGYSNLYSTFKDFQTRLLRFFKNGHSNVEKFKLNLAILHFVQHKKSKQL